MKYFAIISLLGMTFLGFGQVGQEFPYMEGESLTNQVINIPKDVAGKYTLIGLAYSKKSENYLQTWFEPTYNQFIYKPDKPSLFGGNYDVNVYFIPMFTGAKRPAYKSVMKKIQKTIDPKLQPHVLFYKGELKSYKKALNFKGKDVPYFFVLDESGKIIYATSGRYTDTKMREITDKVEDSWN
ncbi:MAG: hypothetical protein KI790_16535 [Cyclobacteriaceae bacterium]|nr:hypothetical protein [Cyclobacteriaceae bacterium HetDA_MAG_MS6]